MALSVRSYRVSLLALTALVLAGCGSSASGPAVPTIAPAKTFEIANFTPAGAIQPGTPTEISFTIQQPSGATLTNFRKGAGPHTGVHLIFVRKDLSSIVHDHPPIAPDGRITDTVIFSSPGPYRLIVDAYPLLSGPLRNFQLVKNLDVAGTYHPKPIPRFNPNVTVDGYRFQMHGKPKLHAIQAAFLTVTVTTPTGQPATFTPWYGALAHAIFIRTGSLDYFHTHICGPQTPACGGFGAPVVGHSTTPGKLQIGVLFPVAGTWRLFLQCQVDGHILTAPFTLRVT
jgi:hypothetical protein